MKTYLATSKDDFFEDVEGVGRFRFRQRTMNDEMVIQRLYADYIGGASNPTAWLITLAEWQAVLNALTVGGPDDWDIGTMDPLNTETYDKLRRVFIALRECESRFRGGPATRVEDGSQEDGERGGSLVSPDVQADA